MCSMWSFHDKFSLITMPTYIKKNNLFERIAISRNRNGINTIKTGMTMGMTSYRRKFRFLRVSFLNEGQIRPRLSKSLDLQNSPTVSYLTKASRCLCSLRLMLS